VCFFILLLLLLFGIAGEFHNIYLFFSFRFFPVFYCYVYSNGREKYDILIKKNLIKILHHKIEINLVKNSFFEDIFSQIDVIATLIYR